MLDDAIMKQMSQANNNGGNVKNQQYGYQEDDYSGDEEYEMKQSQPLTLEQQKEELKRKLQMISTKGK